MNAAAEPIDGGKATLAELRRAGIAAVRCQTTIIAVNGGQDRDSQK
jgi:hypothetical protein